jgi:ribose-phosphate pyrophosphokinase
MTIRITDNNGTTIEATHLGFSGGERHVQLAPIDPSGPAPTRLTLRASLATSDDIFDLLLTRNALLEAYGNVPMDIEIPYLPYARQDRVCAPGQAFSLKVFADVLGPITAPNRLAVWDCHSNVGLTLTGAINVDASAIVKSHDKLRALIAQENTVLVCPDKGARARCENMAKALGDRPLIYCEKVRDPSTGKILGTEVHVESLVGKTAVITDDICDGGMTFIKIAEQLKAKRADKVVLFVTHGIFSKGLDVFDGLIDHIFTTNSFPQVTDPRLTSIDYEYDFPRGTSPGTPTPNLNEGR